jgi:hypothetical protein
MIKKEKLKLFEIPKIYCITNKDKMNSKERINIYVFKEMFKK